MSGAVEGESVEDREEYFNGDMKIELRNGGLQKFLEKCWNRATQIIAEPYTPAAFTMLVCDDCAKSQINFGYISKGAIPETDLVVLAEREVITAAKEWAVNFSKQHVSLVDRYKGQRELLAAITLLESREAMAATIHLDAPESAGKGIQ